MESSPEIRLYHYSAEDPQPCPVQAVRGQYQAHDGACRIERSLDRSKSHNFGEISVELPSGGLKVYPNSTTEINKAVEFTGRYNDPIRRATKNGQQINFIIGDHDRASIVAPSFDWWQRTSDARGRTATFKIDLADGKHRVYHIATITADGSPLTVEKGLRQVFADQDLEFRATPHGRFMSRVGTCSNRNTDRSYSDLPPAEREHYRRVVMMYHMGKEPPGVPIRRTMDVAATPLYNQDQIGIYCLEHGDVMPLPKAAYFTVNNAQNDKLVFKSIQAGDVIHLDVKHGFRNVIGSRVVDPARPPGDRMCHGGGFYGKRRIERVQRPTYVDDSSYVDIPDAGWYGLEVSFGTSVPRKWYSLPELGAVTLGQTGYPEYEATFRFAVTPKMLDDKPKGALRVRQLNQASLYPVGLVLIIVIVIALSKRNVSL